jgi:hypothetical protein
MTVMSSGQLIIGGGTELTFTLNEQESVPQVFVAIAVTSVVPRVKIEPSGILYETVGVGRPVRVGEPYKTVAVVHSVFAMFVISDAHAIVGKEQVV